MHRRSVVTTVILLFTPALSEGQRTGARADGPGPGEAMLLAAGDVAECRKLEGAKTTAKLLDRFPTATIAMLGDGAYPDGSLKQYRECYGPTWGRHRDRTRPATGNHDYDTKGAAGYFGYFGSRAGDPSRGYYRYQLGNWHMFVLNSSCGQVGGCGGDSKQARWLRAELAKTTADCLAAYWHHPRFFSSAGGRGERVWASSSDTKMSSMWRALQEAGADVVLGGHYHVYERLAPLRIEDGGKVVRSSRGIRSFVVGTGGGPLDRFTGKKDPHSEVRIDGKWGVLRLTLAQDSYQWEFIDTSGRVRDSGRDHCRPGGEAEGGDGGAES